MPLARAAEAHLVDARVVEVLGDEDRADHVGRLGEGCDAAEQGIRRSGEAEFAAGRARQIARRGDEQAAAVGRVEQEHALRLAATTDTRGAAGITGRARVAIRHRRQRGAAR